MGKKRGQNEGSIYKRADGRWVAVVNHGYVNGKRKRQYLYGDTRREVSEKLTKALHDRAQGLPIPKERLTVGQFLDDWHAQIVTPRRRPKTTRSYEQVIRLHLRPALGRIRLQKLTPAQIQALLNERASSGLSLRTVQYIHATLRAALNQALRWGLVARNVATLVEPPSAPRHEPTPLTPETARLFLDAIQGHRWEALFSVPLAIGLRLGESLGLCWDDVDLTAGTITVRRQLQRVDGRFQLTEPKSKQSRRTIELPAVAVTALRAHRVKQLEQRLAVGEAWQEWGLVFTTEIGTPIDDSNVRRELRKITKAAGLPHLRFHDLRHTCASLLLAQNVHPRVVMEILGHSEIRLTLDTYSHVIPTLQREAAERIDAILGAR